MQLIVGLGNPGDKYEMTRHNIGMLAIDKIAEDYNVEWHYENKFEGYVANVSTNHGNLFLLKPTTFMNCSGKSVSAIMKFYKISAKEILVLHDEIDLPSGVMRFKSSGSLNGHNGLRDISKAIGTEDFYRLRIGVDRPTKGFAVSDYVLAKISTNTADNLLRNIHNLIHVLPNIIKNEMSIAIQEIHRNN